MKLIYQIIGGVLFITAMIAAFKMQGCRQKAIKQTKNAVQIGYDSVKHWRDLYNREHATAELVKADRDVIRALYGNKVDSLCKILGRKPKHINTMAEVEAEAKAEVSVPTRVEYVHDTVAGKPSKRQRFHFSWHDEYLRISGVADSVKTTLNYHIILPVHITTYWKRRWFLGRKRYYIDAYSDNKHVTLTKVKGIKIN